MTTTTTATTPETAAASLFAGVFNIVFEDDSHMTIALHAGSGSRLAVTGELDDYLMHFRPAEVADLLTALTRAMTTDPDAVITVTAEDGGRYVHGWAWRIRTGAALAHAEAAPLFTTGIELKGAEEQHVTIGGLLIEPNAEGLSATSLTDDVKDVVIAHAELGPGCTAGRSVTRSQDAPAADLASWAQTLRAQRAAAQDVARLVADTLRVQFPQASYLVLYIDYDRDFATDLFPSSIRDAQGQILTEFDSSRLPSLPATDPLRARWGSFDPTDVVLVRYVLRSLRLSGGEFDNFPEDLRHDYEDEGYIPCLLLSPQARPERWDAGEAEDGDDHERLLRPYSAQRPASGTAD